ncbi:MAG: hypothetical protein HZB42_11235 [Sphingobacteriales bacterium]|nr:hypothetical protein [Sphingobacteriales bacterium]
MKAIMVFVMLLFFVPFIRAQQYIIRYNVAGEDIKYLRVRKPGDTAAVTMVDLSKTKRVNLHLINSANSYRREIKYVIREEQPETVIIPGMGSNPVKNISSGLAELDLKPLKMDDIFKRTDDKSFEILTETSAQKTAKQEFAIRYNDFLTMYSKWRQAVIAFEQNSEQLWRDLAGLRYTMEYPAEEIRQTARTKMKTVFPYAEESVMQPSINSSSLFQREATDAKNSFAELAKIYLSFKDVQLQSNEATALMKEAFEKMNLINSGIASVGGKSIEDIIARINNLFRQIISDNYSYLTPLEINRKTIMTEIRFTPVIDSATSVAINLKPQDTIKKWIPIYKKEPLRFRNTFGFSFVSFAENRWHYYVTPDSIIARESADQFQPVIVTYLHFYAPKDKGFRWGGSFGAGLPVGGDNTKLNLMLGLSTFLGKSDPVCITAGVSGAQVKKLSGVKYGDKVNLSVLTNNNYTSVYRVGYFLSLSFNYASLNLKD